MSNETPDQGSQVMQETLTEQASTVVDDYLSKLVGEGKQYKDEQELAKGKVHADQFIETLKAEKAELEEKLNLTQKQEDHLQTIVGLIKETKEPKIEETVKVEENMEVKKQEPQTLLPTVDDDMNRQEFAKLAVEKYGNAVVAGEKMKEYISGDKAKEEVVLTLMRKDPSALLNILPGPTKSMNPTGDTSMTGDPAPMLPMTHTEAVSVFEKDRRRYQSSEFQKLITAGQLAARAAGIKWTDT